MFQTQGIMEVATSCNLQLQLQELLQKIFGHQNYRSLKQKEAVVTLVTENSDIFVCMPTGRLNWLNIRF